VPRYHGLVAGRYLVLDFIDGRPTGTPWADRWHWFDQLLAAARDPRARRRRRPQVKSI
jgi:hypothetical protein